MLAQALADLEVPAKDLASLSFSAATVSTALNKLKHGKAEGGCMTSDHLISAPQCFAEVLAPVFNCLVEHGYMPLVFRDAVIIPIAKGGNTDLSQSSNYRGVALASTLFQQAFGVLYSGRFWKLFPLLSPSVWFQTRVVYHDVHWCAEGMQLFLVGGSCVYSCLVDASKAFDIVDHTLLLEKLLRRSLPICVV